MPHRTTGSRPQARSARRAGNEVYDRPDRARILKYGKIAYWLHARDNERYADAWKAFRLCSLGRDRAMREGEDVASGMGGTRAVG